MPLAEIGTWTDNGEAITARKQSAVSGKQHNGMIECDNDYASAPADDRVFHGRVGLDAANWQGVIYHGRQFPARRLPAVAAAFHLKTWRAEHDPVYDLRHDEN